MVNKPWPDGRTSLPIGHKSYFGSVIVNKNVDTLSAKTCDDVPGKMGKTGEIANQMAKVRAWAASGLHYSYRAKSRAQRVAVSLA